MSEVVIPVGKGRVRIKKNVSKEAVKGKYVVMRSTARTGPCNDDLCQIIRGVKISLEVPGEDEDELSIFAGEGLFLAIDKSIVNSIDKGRQDITVGLGLTGRPYIKGLNYAD
ncbi:hypothetical protein IX51_05765 [uncultured archaeon]|nr:hypothetical protein IX51_05765 [uncultured archaeon]HKJ96393.1 hypothetical protein [Thermoplasmataceae archaeon]